MQFLLVLLLTTVVFVIQSSQTYVKKFKLSDLKTSASGYTYHSTFGRPVSYVHIANYPYNQPVAQYIQFDSHTTPIKVLEIHDKKELEDVSSDNLEIKDEKDKSYLEKKGKKYDSSDNTSSGEKSDKEYKNQHAYKKGQSGRHGEENEKGTFAMKSGQHKNHNDSASHYDEHYDNGSGSRNENFAISTSHKKGRKTTGFHKVYHKDEYKKDHVFYDERNKNGHYEKFGNHQNDHSVTKGGFQKEGNSEAVHRESNSAKIGSYNNNKFENQLKGYKNDAENEQHYSDHSNFSKEQGKSKYKQYGFK